MSDVEAVKNLVERHQQLRREIAKRIVGQQEVVDQILLSVFIFIRFGIDNDIVVAVVCQGLTHLFLLIYQCFISM